LGIHGQADRSRVTDPPVVYTVRVGNTGGYRAITLVRVSAARGSRVTAVKNPKDSVGRAPPISTTPVT
jgi:hypothetical protein